MKELTPVDPPDMLVLRYIYVKMENNDNYIKELLQKYAEGICNKEELDVLLTYLNKNEKLRDLLRDMKESFVESTSSPDQIEEETSLRMKKRLLDQLEMDRKVVPIHQFGNWWKYVAAILVFVAFGYWFTLPSNKSEAVNSQVVTTIPGEQKEVVLPDNSIVFMNGDSELSYPEKFNSTSRVVKLKGEAFFQVKSDKQHPFYVIGNDFTTKVVGTSFNIDTQLDPSVSVTSGTVKVVKLSGNESEKVLLKENDITLRSERYPTIQLIANEKASFDENSISWRKEQNVKNLNWKDGEIAFYNKKIDFIVNALERYYGVEIKVSDELKQCEFTLPLINNDLNKTLRLLGKLSGATVKNAGNSWELKGGGCKF